jgi:hypothetical protein
LLENDTDFSQNGFAPVVRRLWQSTGLSMRDMHCAQIYENFSYQSVAVLIEHSRHQHGYRGRPAAPRRVGKSGTWCQDLSGYRWSWRTDQLSDICH